MKQLKQQCHISFIYLSWVIFIAGLAFFLISANYIVFIAWLLGVPLFQWLYIVNFPKLSTMMGYGSVNDKSPIKYKRIETEVTFYTGLGCPFCPIVKKRLIDSLWVESEKNVHTELSDFEVVN